MILLTNTTCYNKGMFEKGNIFIDKGINVPSKINFCSCSPHSKSIDATNLIIIPSFVDVHTHLREPGFFYKGSIYTGTLEGRKNGYTCLFSMPNLNPAPDSLENLQIQQDIIDRDAVIDVLPYGTITKGENGEVLSDMDDLAPKVIAFSDDGKGVQNNDIMKKAMLKAKELNKIIVAHCEDNTLLNGGYIHAGKYADANNHKGIVSASEFLPIKRDIELVRQTGCRYHICHISTKESVELVRQAKKDGLNVTCETAPHYLTLCEDDLKETGNYKMNPPLRSKEDRDALIEGLNDGTIDIIATDHAPHSIEEKSKGLEF
ncbi:MAG: dihydroorotase, partial [Clostridia bacterium]